MHAQADDTPLNHSKYYQCVNPDTGCRMRMPYFNTRVTYSVMNATPVSDSIRIKKYNAFFVSQKQRYDTSIKKSGSGIAHLNPLYTDI